MSYSRITQSTYHTGNHIKFINVYSVIFFFFFAHYTVSIRYLCLQMTTVRGKQPETLPCKPDWSLVLSRLSSSLPVQLACRHLTTASLYLSQPSDLCVNRRHQQLTLTQRASAHLQGKPSPNAFSIDFRYD